MTPHWLRAPDLWLRTGSAWFTRIVVAFVCVVAASPGAAAPAAQAPSPAVSRPSPEPPDPRIARAEQALLQGDVEAALGLAREAADAKPPNATALVLLARVHLAQGELEPARAALDRALAIDARNVDALAYLGYVAGKLAAATFERLKAEAPGSARLKQLEAETYELQDRHHDAEAAYEAALAVDPTLLDALLPLARLKRGRLACEEAVPLYERAEKVQATFDAAYGLGFCHAYLQEDEEAIANYELAVERDPTAAVAWSGLGQALAKSGRTTEGIRALRRAVTLEPRMSDAWYMLGMAHQSAGDSAQANAAFAKAEEIRKGGTP